MYRLLIIGCLVGMALLSPASSGWWNADTVASSIPGTVTRSPEEFAAYLTNRFPDDTDRVKALFSWISHSIVYDMDQSNVAGKYESMDEFVRGVLNTKKAVCQGYAEVFTAVCNLMGIPAMTVHGYTQIDGHLQSETGHAWNVAKVGGRWYLFDPTWGSGYLDDSLITTHMPFDPIWQLKEYPVTHDQFINGIRPGSTFYNYSDSLDRYYVLDEISRAEATLRRAEATNANRREIQRIYRKYNDYVVNLRCNSEITRYNASSDMLRDAIDRYNTFQKLRGRRGINPDKLRQWLQLAGGVVQNSRRQAETLSPCHSLSVREIQELLKNISEVEIAIATEFRRLH
ncbi:MAG: transglutaminase domain-containing protein [Bacteroidales bacterium]|nr:transglutaminase domain-containing protein [Bacteroidales bacterium]